MTRNLAKYSLLIAMVILTCLSCNNAKKNKAPVDKEVADWKYFGLPSPGNVPQIFSPDIISTSRNERDFAITPAGNVLFYSIVFPSNNLSVIVYLAFDGFFWSEPECAGFSGIYKDLEPAFSPDGKKLFFVSNRPVSGNSVKKDYDIWIVEPEKGWNLAVNAGSPVNTDENEYYPSVASNGNLYFTAKYQDSFGMEDIFFSKFENGTYTQPVNLGETINSANYEFNAFIAPDESYLIFSSYGREDDLGGGDLYISFKNGMNVWSKPKNMGSTINSNKLDYCPFVTPDGKYLFFTSERSNAGFEDKKQKKLGNLLQMADGIENGLGNIYWVTFDTKSWKN